MNRSQSVDLEEFMQQAREKQKLPYTARSDEMLVSVKEYAKKVGKTPGAITKQLCEKRLDGVKIGSRWMVKIIDPSRREESEKMSQLREENIRLKAQIDMIRNALFMEE